MLTALGPHDGKDSIQLCRSPSSPTGPRTTATSSPPRRRLRAGREVGIVQCAKEAGGETREQRGGIDGCDIGPFTYATADADGVATGDFQVQRVLTTPLTGTVDCAAEAERCLVAMGALSDYDRSGGFGITFAAPLTASPARTSRRVDGRAPPRGCTDGDTVHVERRRLRAPASSWASASAPRTRPRAGQTGERSTGQSSSASQTARGARRRSALGHVEADARLALPARRSSRGTYVDCAVSACSLRVEPARHAPPPLPLALRRPGARGPIPPAVAVDPEHRRWPRSTDGGACGASASRPAPT